MVRQIIGILFTVLGLGTGLATAGVSAPPNPIENVRAYELASGRTELRIDLAQRPASIESYRVIAPDPKIVLDIPGAMRRESQRHFEFAEGTLDGVNLYQHDGGVRVVVDVDSAAGYRAFTEGRGVTVLLEPAPGATGR